MDIPYGGVDGNEATDDELSEHRLTFDDAEDVWNGAAKYFPQPTRHGIDAGGRSFTQPERLKMVGPDRTGRLLTFILELPDDDGWSHVVTGWRADRDEQTRYHQPGGRMRRR